MRKLHALPLVAALLLAACGGDADTDNDGNVTAAEAAVEAQGAVQMQPGQYAATGELLEFEVPGAPAEGVEMMRTAMAGGLAAGGSFCLSEEEARGNGAENMIKELAETDCTMSKFDVDGGRVVAEMQCPGEGGLSGTVKVEGQTTSTSSVMTMEFDTDLGDGQVAHVKMQNTARRTGECTTS